jgi:hypothetical protein
MLLDVGGGGTEEGFANSGTWLIGSHSAKPSFQTMVLGENCPVASPSVIWAELNFHVPG